MRRIDREAELDRELQAYSPQRVGAAVTELVAKMHALSAGDEFLAEVLEDLRGTNERGNHEA